MTGQTILDSSAALVGIHSWSANQSSTSNIPLFDLYVDDICVDHSFRTVWYVHFTTLDQSYSKDKINYYVCLLSIKQIKQTFNFADELTCQFPTLPPPTRELRLAMCNNGPLAQVNILSLKKT